MRIGIDFDNTIAAYDRAFSYAAGVRGLIPPGHAGTKRDIRDAVRRLDGGEMEWRKLQGHVYGAGIGAAELFDGVGAFLRRCRDSAGTEVCIVSHKTEYSRYDPQKISLHDAARDWMADRGFFSANGFAIPRENLFFEATRDDKIARIETLGCTVFIDDLVEVLDHPGFPAGVRRILFTDGRPPEKALPYPAFATWPEIEEAVLGQRT